MEKFVHKCGNKKYLLMLSSTTISLKTNRIRLFRFVLFCFVVSVRKAGIAVTWKGKESNQAMRGARNAKMALKAYFTHWYSAGTEKA